MLTHLKKMIPVRIKRWLRSRLNDILLIQAIFYDYYRFRIHSGVFRRHQDEASRGALITKYYHMIEKGLALPSPRPKFGLQAIHDLCKLVEQAMRDGVCSREVILAVDAIEGWRAFNSANGVETPAWAESLLQEAMQAGMTISGSPIKSLAAERREEPDYLGFIVSRTSVRNFSDASVPRQVLENAVRAAQAAPCVCNRQAGNIYFVTDPAKKKAVLACQNGNRGFGESTPVVAIITVDLQQFVEPSERYQGWIDGGMFAMNFLLGIHAQGYGACALNWSALPEQDKRLRKEGVIPEAESVIMMVAVGGLKESFSVARSARRPTDDVIDYI